MAHSSALNAILTGKSGYLMEDSRKFADGGGSVANSTISYLWRDPKAAAGFRTGVSLHSHTNQSKETLDFLANLGSRCMWIRPLLSRLERRAQAVQSLRIDYAAGYWTPPMTPKL